MIDETQLGTDAPCPADVDDNRALAKTFGVTSAPFVAVLKHKRW